MHADDATLTAALAAIRESPRDGGIVELIVRRPGLDKREVLARAELDPDAGLVGDTWPLRPSRRTADGGPSSNAQLTLMNARAIAAIAGPRDRWPLAGDQLYVDLDLSVANLPAGTRLAVGSAILEITDEPHTGCAKFARRFGPAAARFIASPGGLALRLRGINARVVSGGSVAIRDRLVKQQGPGDVELEGRVRSALDAFDVPYRAIACDPALAETANFCARYGFTLEQSANCIVVAAKEDPRRYAACVVLAVHKLDVNGVVRRRLGARKCSFASADETGDATGGMLIGGVTPFGLPPGLPIWIDGRVMAQPEIIVGGGSRSLKLLLSPEVFRRMPAVEIVESLARS